MDFLNHRERGMVFHQVFFLSQFTIRGCVSLKKYKSLGKAVRVTMNNKEENSLDFVQEFGLSTSYIQFLASFCTPLMCGNILGIANSIEESYTIT
jgi:hypothetical protein